MDSTDTHCPDCGNPIPDVAPLGMCPECLLGSALDTSANDTTIDSGKPETAAPSGELAAPGMVIGRYKLRQQIGEGGFGVVYLAEQTKPVKRRVALKVIKAGMDSKEIIARFEAERQALALMDHPNIAKIHDAGTTENGRPYFVMELVKGVPITDYCANQNLDTKARLGLFNDVCAAVQHAHQKGIIHRDLKPSNILVSPHDGKPVVKVIDFGIAKAISMELSEKTMFTRLGQMMGTPQYMSPEQAELNALDIDTRSDIYSLGVVLYELLTGTTPLDGEQLRSAAYGEMQRLIREETPAKPSTRISATKSKSTNRSNPSNPHALRGDLDWITMKALEKDRARRYESAGALAEDISRYLQLEPIMARPPSKIYAATRFARRHRGAVFAGAGLLSVLLLGVVGTSIGMKRAVDAKEEVIQKNEELDEQKLVLVDYKERLAGLLDSNQRMLEKIGKTGTGETEVSREIDELRRSNQALLDSVNKEVGNQKRYSEQIESLQQAHAQLVDQVESGRADNADLEGVNAGLRAGMAELQSSLSTATRRPAGKYTGPITFSYPVAERKGLRSIRTVEFGEGGEKVTFTSDAYTLDASGQQTGVAKKSSVELIGSWDGSVFRSAGQRVIATDFATWSQEEISLSFSSRTNRIDWMSTFKYAGNTVVGKGQLAPLND